MRLIDADAINTKTFVDFVGNQGYISFGDALWMISKQPTAYDVEEVINVVRETGAKLCCNKSCNNNCDCCVVDDAVRDIIDAIRKGGVKNE